VDDLVIEMDTFSVKGMLNNPDLQPNTTINRWIAAIKLFTFRLEHVLATHHKGPDGLSRRIPANHERIDTADVADEWIDDACGFVLISAQIDTLPKIRIPPTTCVFGIDTVTPADNVIELQPPLVPLPPCNNRANAADARV
jgi:hypothetical protein